MQDDHEGYIDWEEFERTQTQLAANAYGRKDGAKSSRGGRACSPVFRRAAGAAVG